MPVLETWGRGGGGTLVFGNFSSHQTGLGQLWISLLLEKEVQAVPHCRENSLAPEGPVTLCSVPQES